MEYSNIKELLDLYFNGETTLSQEKSLRDYFTSDRVDKRLKPYKALFESYNKAGQEVFKGSLALEPQHNKLQTWLPRVAALLLSILRELMYVMAHQFNKATKTLSLVDEFQVHKNKYLK